MTDRFDALIIGGGMTADAAAKGFREVDAEGSIAILSEDVDPPYARPALSKKLWTDPDFSWEDKVDLHTEETGATEGVKAVDPASMENAKGEVTYCSGKDTSDRGCGRHGRRRVPRAHNRASAASAVDRRRHAVQQRHRLD